MPRLSVEPAQTQRRDARTGDLPSGAASARSVRWLGPFELAEAIADAAYGLDRIARRAQLVAQALHRRIDRAQRHRLCAPDGFAQLHARDDDPRLALQLREHGELARARKRQLIVFDRFLARIVAVLGDAATLKGGLVLELRLERARTTKDVDLRMVGSTVDVLAKLQEAGRKHLG